MSIQNDLLFKYHSSCLILFYTLAVAVVIIAYS
jgi:hypothetical protein